MHMRMPRVKQEQTISTRRPAATRPSAEQQVRPAGMTRDVQVSGQIVGNVPMQCAYTLILAAGSAPAALQKLQDNGQKFPDFPDISGARLSTSVWLSDTNPAVFLMNSPTCGMLSIA